MDRIAPKGTSSCQETKSALHGDESSLGEKRAKVTILQLDL